MERVNNRRESLGRYSSSHITHGFRWEEGLIHQRQSQSQNQSVGWLAGRYSLWSLAFSFWKPWQSKVIFHCPVSFQSLSTTTLLICCFYCFYCLFINCWAAVERPKNKVQKVPSKITDLTRYEILACSYRRKEESIYWTDDDGTVIFHIMSIDWMVSH